jgi:DHA1 family tetracycline resistance protein-like MFS transporter
MPRAAALPFLLVTVFVDMLGLGLVVPIVPALMTGLTGGTASAALWSGLIATSYGLLQFLTAPLLGGLADRFGRRPVLLVSLFCLGIDWLGHAITPAVGWLLLFHGLAGLFAGSGTVVNAYVADVTPASGRARAYGLIGAAFGLGFVAGPSIGGLLGAVDLRLPFYAAAALAFANVAYGFFLLPESRPGDPAAPLTLRATNPIGALAAVLRRPVLGRLTVARFCSDIARNVHQAVWTFFVTHQFAWGTAHLGATMACGALAGVAFQAKAVGPVVGLLGDKRAAVAGSLCAAVSLALTAVVSAPWMVYALQALGVLGLVAGAATQSWISRAASAAGQGAVNGALTSTAALAEMSVPVAAGALFAWSVAHGVPGAVFAVAAVFTITATLVLAGTRDSPAAAAPGVTPV